MTSTHGIKDWALLAASRLALGTATLYAVMRSRTVYPGRRH